jgi:hypothetical protein
MSAETATAKTQASLESNVVLMSVPYPAIAMKVRKTTHSASSTLAMVN